MSTKLACWRCTVNKPIDSFQGRPIVAQRAGLTVTRVGAYLGAEITGVDLRQPISDEVRDAIENALVENELIIFRNQDISSENLIDFGRRFGKLTVHPFAPRDENVSALIKFRNDETDPPFRTDVWHYVIWSTVTQEKSLIGPGPDWPGRVFAGLLWLSQRAGPWLRCKPSVIAPKTRQIGELHDQISVRHRRRDHGRLLMRAAGPRPGRDRPAFRHCPLRHVVQRGRAAAFRPRHALPAFVLVSRVEADIRGCAQGRS